MELQLELKKLRRKTEIPNFGKEWETKWTAMSSEGNLRIGLEGNSNPSEAYSALIQKGFSIYKSKIIQN